jgi:hypothetical protein
LRGRSANLRRDTKIGRLRRGWNVTTACRGNRRPSIKPPCKRRRPPMLTVKLTPQILCGDGLPSALCGIIRRRCLAVERNAEQSRNRAVGDAGHGPVSAGGAHNCSIFRGFSCVIEEPHTCLRIGFNDALDSCLPLGGYQALWRPLSARCAAPFPNRPVRDLAPQSNAHDRRCQSVHRRPEELAEPTGQEDRKTARLPIAAPTFHH